MLVDLAGTFSFMTNRGGGVPLTPPPLERKEGIKKEIFLIVEGGWGVNFIL